MTSKEIQGTAYGLARNMQAKRDVMIALDGLQACYKPPLGIMPEWLWISQRRSDLKEAIVRYLDADKTIPAEWVEEHKRHCEWLNKLEETKK